MTEGPRTVQQGALEVMSMGPTVWSEVPIEAALHKEWLV